jgi:hypothetical protein
MPKDVAGRMKMPLTFQLIWIWMSMLDADTELQVESLMLDDGWG